MSHDLDATLDQLRRDRAALASDDERRRQLDELIADLEAHRDDPDDPERRERLDERLGHAVERFEASHPDLTLRLNQIMATLSGSGI